ncbi:MAG: hypothetical protein ABIH11_04320 [Candidatus Altiarchaeota archaeon]
MGKIVLSLLCLMSLAFSASAAENCQNIYCNDFNYVCCCSYGEDADSMEVALMDKNPLSGNPPVTCPDDIDVKKCRVHLRGELMLALGYDYFIGSGVCSQQVESEGYSRWKCAEEKQFHLALGQSVSKDLKPGESIYVWSGSNIMVEEAYIDKYILRGTGKAADCTAGKQIPGSVGCTFNPEGYDRVYDSKGGLYGGGSSNIGEGQCFEVTDFSLRRQCDNTCDQCSGDGDCASIYPYQRKWGNRTLGAVCSGNKLMLYGCEPTGQKICVEKDVLPDGTVNCIKQKDRKSCSMVRQITTGIECCTSDDCRGAGDFYCKWITDTESKCVLKAECEKDADCGTAVKCDMPSKSIIEPYCSEDKQCGEKPVAGEVGCCTTRDCPKGSYCSSSYQCVGIPGASELPGNEYPAGNVVYQEGYSTATVIVLALVIISLAIPLGLVVYLFKTGKLGFK